MQDFARYLARIGLETTPTLDEMHLAHATAIPFENLDPLRGQPNALDPEALETKLVVNHRGGYCFEQNLLFKEALAHLGITEVDLVLARVRAGGRPGLRPRTHLILKVRENGNVWHADVGFGGDGLLYPIPYGPGETIEQNGWRYRVVEDGNEFVLQMEEGGEFVDLYGFVDEACHRIDAEVNNWYVCTFPRSPFTTALYCSYREPGRRWTISERTGACVLTEKTPVGKTERVLNDDEVEEIFPGTFHLPAIVRREGRWQLAHE